MQTFTAAQAAQKRRRRGALLTRWFTAAQAAQKVREGIVEHELTVHCRTGSSEIRGLL